jgi:Tn7-like transposition protein D/TniQ protein
MIGFFPEPYPDELFYSLCARYHQRAMYTSPLATTRDLFGAAHTRITIDLPGHLNRLATALPPGHGYSVERLINEHTLLPFYAPFMPPERFGRLRQDMAGDARGGFIHVQTGILNSKIRLESLRFCPRCVKEDRRRYGETYWHRLHQVPGVMVCPEHAVWLEQSSQRPFQLVGRKMLATANQVVPVVRERFLDTQSRDHQAHLRIARDVDWLLNHHLEPNRLDELKGRYLGALVNRHLATPTGIIRMRRLQAQFLDFHSTQFLNELRCGLDCETNWLVRMVQSGRHTQHPIHHLVLIHFLGFSAAEFFQLPTTPQPFGAGPWPCLNPVCNHYRERVITTCQVRTRYSGGERLMGTFRCECGFSYCCTKPPLRGNRERSGRIAAFGPAWGIEA